MEGRLLRQDYVGNYGMVDLTLALETPMPFVAGLKYMLCFITSSYLIIGRLMIGRKVSWRVMS